MSRFKRKMSVLAGVACLALLVASGSTQAQPADMVPGTYATVVIGDLSGFLDKAGALAEKIVPGMNGSVIKTQVGSMLGDPELKGFPAGAGLVLVVPESGQPYGLAEVAEGKTDDMEKLAQGRGIQAQKVKDGLLALAANDTALKQADSDVGKAAAALLDGNGEATVVATVQAQKLMKKYKSQIEDGMRSFPEKMSAMAPQTSGTVTSESIRMMEVTMAGYYVLAKKVDVAQITLDPEAGGLRVDKTIFPIGGFSPSNLTGPTGAELLKFLPGKGSMRGEFNFNTAALGKASSNLMLEIGKETKMAEEDAKAMAALMLDYGEAFGDAASFSWAMDKAVDGGFAITLKDETKALDWYSKWADSMSSGPMSKLYTMHSPISAKFERNVREVDGVKIHRYIQDMDFKGASNEALANAFSHQVWEIAVIANTMLFSTGSAKIEDLIAAVKSGSNPSAKELVSKEKLASGARVYFDFNFGAMMATGMELAPKSKVEAIPADMITAMKNAKPFLMAAYANEGNIKFSTLVPVEVMQAIGKMGAKAASKKKNKDDSTEDSKENSRTKKSDD